MELVEKYAEDVGMDEEETLALMESTEQLEKAVAEGTNGDAEGSTGEEAATVAGRLMRIAGPPIPTESGVIVKPLAARKAEQDQDTDVIENEDTDPSNPRLLNVEGIVHADGLNVYKDQAGRLWTGLATYWIKRGEFDRATATFEQGLATVLTIRDFTQIFDAYAEFSETMISTLMDALADEENLEDEDFDAEDTEKDLDERMKAFEILMDRRPFLVNDVLLRRNPNEVVEWEKRIALHGTDDDKVVETYIKALDTISPRKATGPLYPLYVNFAKFYEQGGSVDEETGESSKEPNIAEARKVFEKGTRVQFKAVDELAELWCEWAEMELRNE